MARGLLDPQVILFAQLRAYGYGEVLKILLLSVLRGERLEAGAAKLIGDEFGRAVVFGAAGVAAFELGAGQEINVRLDALGRRRGRGLVRRGPDRQTTSRARGDENKQQR